MQQFITSWFVNKFYLSECASPLVNVTIQVNMDGNKTAFQSLQIVKNFPGCKFTKYPHGVVRDQLNEIALIANQLLARLNVA